MNYDTFGERIKSTRKRIDISQAELAKGCGIPQGTISRIELGNQESSKFIFTMADILHCDARWLATGEGGPKFTVPYGMSISEFNKLKKSLDKISVNLLKNNRVSFDQANVLNAVILKISDQISKGIEDE